MLINLWKNRSREKGNITFALKNSARSTNSGIRHIKLACSGAGGSFSLIPNMGLQSILLTLSFPAALVPATKVVLPRKLSTDDTQVPCFGNFRTPHNLVTPKSIGICVIDDSMVRNRIFVVINSFNRSISCKMICKGYSKLLLPLLEATEESSCVICPKCLEDIDYFIERVLGKHLRHPIPDVCLLDQNIQVVDKAK